MLDAAPPPLAGHVRGLFRAWNGLAPWPARWPEREAWRAHVRAWRETLGAQTDLTSRLLAFAAAKR